MSRRIEGRSQTENNYPKLTESEERLKRYEAELPQCDSATRPQLLAAWKEEIIEDLVELLRAIDDIGGLSKVDRAIALSGDIIQKERE